LNYENLDGWGENLYGDATEPLITLLTIIEMAKEKDDKNKLKRLEEQYYRFEGNERRQAGLLGQIETLKKKM